MTRVLVAPSPGREQIPEPLIYATPGSSGIDLVATDISYSEKHGFIEYGTGVSFDIPPNTEGQLRARSSISKKPLVLCNGVGTIDSDYRGEVRARFRVLGHPPLAVEQMVRKIQQGDKTSTLGALAHEALYVPGDKISQIVFAPILRAEVVHVKSLSNTQRGEGGFGSTGE